MFKRMTNFRGGLAMGLIGMFLLPKAVYFKIAETYYTLTEIEDIK
jgi:hypothetical protein